MNRNKKALLQESPETEPQQKQDVWQVRIISLMEQDLNISGNKWFACSTSSSQYLFHLFFLQVRVCDEEINCIHSVIAVLFFHYDIRTQTWYTETA